MADEMHSPVPEAEDDRPGISSSGGGEDLSDEDEGDLFTKSYLGLDTSMADVPAADGGDGGDEGGPSGSDLPDDGPPDDGPPDSDGDSNDDDDDNDDPKPRGAGRKRKRTKSKWKVQSRRSRQITGEMFDDALYENEARSWVTLRHTVPGGPRFVQRDQIPPFTALNDEELDDVEELVAVAYPSNPEIPAPRGNRYDGSPWVLGKDSIYRKADPKGKGDKKEDLVWRPTFVLRLFDQRSGSYLSNTQFQGLFNEVIESNFSANSVMKYNKRVRQWLSRNCTNHRTSTIEHSPWSHEEIAEAVRYLNSLVRRHGVIHVADTWDEVVKGAIPVLDAFRKKAKMTARGGESTRTRFKRAVGVEEKLKKVKEGGDVGSKRENFFDVGDFRSIAEVEREKRKGKAKESAEEGTKTKKRGVAGKRKETVSDADEEGAEMEVEDDEDGEGEEDDEEEDEEEAEDVMPPPEKRRKH